MVGTFCSLTLSLHGLDMTDQTPPGAEPHASCFYFFFSLTRYICRSRQTPMTMRMQLAARPMYERTPAL